VHLRHELVVGKLAQDDLVVFVGHHAPRAPGPPPMIRP
jgi:hypothetical protein